MFWDSILSIGRAIVDFVEKLTVEEVKVFVKAVVELGKELGILDKDTDIIELGDKAIQAEHQGKNLEDYDSSAEFVASLDDVETDDVESEKISDEDKLTKGAELVAQLIAEKYDGFDVEKYAECQADNPEYFTPERIREFGKLIKEDCEIVNDIVDYINGSEVNIEKRIKDEEVLVGIEKAIDSSISDGEALQKVREAFQ